MPPSRYGTLYIKSNDGNTTLFSLSLEDTPAYSRYAYYDSEVLPRGLYGVTFDPMPIYWQKLFDLSDYAGLSDVLNSSTPTVQSGDTLALPKGLGSITYYVVPKSGGGSMLDVTYNSTKIINNLEVTPPVAVTYNGSTIATLNEGDTKTLQCNGKVMSSNIVIGGKTLQCNGKVMASDVVVSVSGQTIPELPPESEWVDNTFLINEGETYQISDVSNYSFNADYQIAAFNNATLVLKNASQQYVEIFFNQIVQVGDEPLNIVVDTGQTEISDDYFYGSTWYSNLAIKAGSSVSLRNAGLYGFYIYGNIVCEEGATLTVSGGTITGDITTNGTLTVDGGTINGDITANGTFIMNDGTINGDITANGTFIMNDGTINTIGTLLKTEPDYAGHIGINYGEMHYGDFIFEVDYPAQLTMLITGGTFYPQNANPNIRPRVKIGDTMLFADQYLGEDMAFEYDSENECWNVGMPPPIIG